MKSEKFTLQQSIQTFLNYLLQQQIKQQQLWIICGNKQSGKTLVQYYLSKDELQFKINQKTQIKSLIPKTQYKNAKINEQYISLTTRIPNIRRIDTESKSIVLFDSPDFKQLQNNEKIVWLNFMQQIINNQKKIKFILVLSQDSLQSSQQIISSVQTISSIFSLSQSQCKQQQNNNKNNIEKIKQQFTSCLSIIINKVDPQKQTEQILEQFKQRIEEQMHQEQPILAECLLEAIKQDRVHFIKKQQVRQEDQELLFQKINVNTEQFTQFSFLSQNNWLDLFTIQQVIEQDQIKQQQKKILPIFNQLNNIYFLVTQMLLKPCIQQFILQLNQHLQSNNQLNFIFGKIWNQLALVQQKKQNIQFKIKNKIPKQTKKIIKQIKTSSIKDSQQFQKRKQDNQQNISIVKMSNQQQNKQKINKQSNKQKSNYYFLLIKSQLDSLQIQRLSSGIQIDNLKLIIHLLLHINSYTNKLSFFLQHKNKNTKINLQGLYSNLIQTINNKWKNIKIGKQKSNKNKNKSKSLMKKPIKNIQISPPTLTQIKNGFIQSIKNKDKDNSDTQQALFSQICQLPNNHLKLWLLVDEFIKLSSYFILTPSQPNFINQLRLQLVIKQLCELLQSHQMYFQSLLLNFMIDNYYSFELSLYHFIYSTNQNTQNNQNDQKINCLCQNKQQIRLLFILLQYFKQSKQRSITNKLQTVFNQNINGQIVTMDEKSQMIKDMQYLKSKKYNYFQKHIIKEDILSYLDRIFKVKEDKDKKQEEPEIVRKCQRVIKMNENLKRKVQKYNQQMFVMRNFVSNTQSIKNI